MELWKQGAAAFIGPEDSCQTEAMMAASVNLPMISYVSQMLKTGVPQWVSSFVTFFGSPIFLVVFFNFEPRAYSSNESAQWFFGFRALFEISEHRSVTSFQGRLVYKIEICMNHNFPVEAVKNRVKWAKLVGVFHFDHFVFICPDLALEVYLDEAACSRRTIDALVLAGFF